MASELSLASRLVVTLTVGLRGGSAGVVSSKVDCGRWGKGRWAGWLAEGKLRSTWSWDERLAWSDACRSSSAWRRCFSTRDMASWGREYGSSTSAALGGGPDGSFAPVAKEPTHKTVTRLAREAVHRQGYHVKVRAGGRLGVAAAGS